ncbi:hypothetical protein IQ07DRAFT_593233 [Pyrenochaeta sp. DS3sAY3a]|nr:hypothetical protein IQ07DRAFT_593233 [Pyrenochaeta sp. DS3sAY3a]
MAVTFRTQGHNLDQYNAIATSQPGYQIFPASIHHVSSSHDLPGYASSNVRSSNTQQPTIDHHQAHQEHVYTSEGLLENTSQMMADSSRPQPDSKFIQDSDDAVLYPSNAQPPQPPPLTPNTAPQGHFDMTPPPNSTHESWQALHDYAQSHASEHGYALSINTTAKNRSRIKLACVCYGQPKNTHKLTSETRVRKNRVSYKTGCKMWVEGKRTEEGAWVLRVGEAEHNHPGRASEGWALQRKRTWGVVGGRIGVGGITAKEEIARLSLSGDTNTRNESSGRTEDHDNELSHQQARGNSTHSLERGGLVWKIVEQEMLRKGEPNQGRDRGVGRTVEVLQSRLPGIHIFKRDVYNIRAQIKRARKAAGQQVGEGLHEEDDDDENDAGAGADPDMDAEPEADIDLDVHIPSDRPPTPPPQQHTRSTRRSKLPAAPEPSLAPRTDPALTSSAAQHDSTPFSSLPTHSKPVAAPAEPELERVRRENAELRRLLKEKTQEVADRSMEVAGLRTQIEYLTSVMLSR